jgi:hypothetical protein
MEFELQFIEANEVLNSFEIYLKYLEVSEICETWSTSFSLHLVSFKIISKCFSFKFWKFI